MGAVRERLRGEIGPECAKCFLFVPCAVASLLAAVTWPSTATADIYQWEWVDPNNHALGRQQSATLAPDGAWLVPEPGMDAISRDLTQAYLIDFDLSGARFYQAILMDADLSGADLTFANFEVATLTNADFTNAEVRGSLFNSSRLSTTQLYSTASYQTGELARIQFSYYRLPLRINFPTGGFFCGR